LIISATLRCAMNDSPKSPRIMCPSQITCCVVIGLSSPIHFAMRWTSASDARGPATVAAGFPGARWLMANGRP
jgi:hypothetical protein